MIAVSPASVCRILSEGGYLNRWNPGPSRKGKGFDQPTRPHEHWHVDITYINISGTFYYLCAVIDGYSRYLVHWDIRPAMLEADIEVILQRATELHPGATPRIITDNGPQFIAKDFKEFIRVKGMTHVRTLPYYPQSNRRLERWNKTLKVCATRPRTPLSLDDARRIVEEFVNTHNKDRLLSAIGDITPADKLHMRHPTETGDAQSGIPAHSTTSAPTRAVPTFTAQPPLRSAGSGPMPDDAAKSPEARKAEFLSTASVCVCSDCTKVQGAPRKHRDAQRQRWRPAYAA